MREMQAPTTSGPVTFVQPGVPQSPTAIWKAAEASRDELRNQLDGLEDKRRSLVGQLEEAPAGTVKAGLETRIADIDKRIADLEKQISSADAAVAKAAS